MQSLGNKKLINAKNWLKMAYILIFNRLFRGQVHAIMMQDEPFIGN
jgi:hypothetical protein